MKSPALSTTAVAPSSAARTDSGGTRPRNRDARPDGMRSLPEAAWLAGNVLGVLLMGLLIDHQPNAAEEHTPLLSSSTPDAPPA
ncbi:hypothetical protein PUR61_24680 [Streptomyces sp. BE20]|uniref:hypothetical protein n=1 Tax=Streptomyces sp. BE20 TaxID=3002525 RepID=UPI002E76AC29|nr:hypothetical protein [Streptomyces sp. BE20]MEE1825352.1 hypothetical protein [Streptomyces sp. BE20]